MTTTRDLSELEPRVRVLEGNPAQDPTMTKTRLLAELEPRVKYLEDNPPAPPDPGTTVSVNFFGFGGGAGSQSGNFNTGNARGGEGAPKIDIKNIIIDRAETYAIVVGAGGNGGPGGEPGNAPGTPGGKTTFANLEFTGGQSSNVGQGQSGWVNPVPGSTLGQLSGASYYLGGYGAQGSNYDGQGATGGGLGGGGAVEQVGATNTGGGGGGVNNPAGGFTAGRAGGSGGAVIYYEGEQKFTGGVVTSANGFTLHTFLSSGNLVGIPVGTAFVEYLLIGGGGSGGDGHMASGAGGGAGAFNLGSVLMSKSATFTVTVGAGGGKTTLASASFGSMIEAVPGGNGGRWETNGGSGGSGGGAGGGTSSFTGGSGVSGQGFAGGNMNGPSQCGGGGGGAGGAGGTAGGNSGASGGVGITTTFSGVSKQYCGGGAGQGDQGNGSSPGFGGGGVSQSGAANTGGGGGALASGGSGVGVIRYLGAQMFTGGVVTFANGYTVHTFNSTADLVPIPAGSTLIDYILVGGGGVDGAGNVGGGAVRTGTTLHSSDVAITVGAVGGTTTALSLSAGPGQAGNGGGSAHWGWDASTNCDAWPGGPGGSLNGVAGNAGGGPSASEYNAQGGTGGAGPVWTVDGLAYAGGKGGGRDGAGSGTAGANGAGWERFGGGAKAGGAVISYLSSTQKLSGGTVTQANGRFFHTFSSSGTLSKI